ncbi:unnamed protein product [Enterobius vermicularis]|uniref:DUF3393 domain-containing protein n=1 Tax=Enterobius vermicularis TaxID=51028 RepID=A0A0N4V8P1_ENTVE|nr:unnamed protein product [Enterobius vermicularis]
MSLLQMFAAVNALNRDELIRYLQYQQETRNTFDSRIDQSSQPIGWIDGEPIWPRILEKVPKTRLFYDENNAGLVQNNITPVDVIKRMDRQENYDRVIKFLDRLTI